MAADDFDIVIEAMLEAPYKKEEVRILEAATCTACGKDS